jgi:hypothetical protein
MEEKPRNVASGKRPFEDIFKTGEKSRDNFLARFFGIFYEKMVPAWCSCPGAPYAYQGRPALWRENTYKHSLDFILRRRETGETFVAEMKCWLAWENSTYLRLEDTTPLHKLKGAAWEAFIELTHNPTAYEIKIERLLLTPPIQGTVLIWGATSEQGRQPAMTTYGFADVLSAESMLDDLNTSNSAEWTLIIDQLKDWSNSLLTYLSSP